MPKHGPFHVGTKTKSKQ